MHDQNQADWMITIKRKSVITIDRNAHPDPATGKVRVLQAAHIEQDIKLRGAGRSRRARLYLATGFSGMQSSASFLAVPWVATRSGLLRAIRSAYPPEIRWRCVAGCRRFPGGRRRVHPARRV
jgi:hypothetical protein